MEITLDTLDRSLLEELSRNARLSWRELASLTGVSAPTVRDRIRRLEDTGVISGFGVELSPKALGFSLEAIVRFKPFPAKVHLLAEKIIACDRIVQCDKVTGEDAFVARMLLRISLNWINCWKTLRYMPRPKQRSSNPARFACASHHLTEVDLGRCFTPKLTFKRVQ
ncbi:Lrp/AsnC family transcriptional regulator [Halovulum sp. GXIMD14793]